MATKDDLHRLIDELPEQELHTALRFLEYLRYAEDDPMIRSLLHAPEDDEEDTAEEREASDRGWQEYIKGKARPWEDVRRELEVD